MTSRIGRRLIAAMLFPIQRIERSRGWRRLAWLGVFGGLGAGVHTLALRQASLRGLPDVGDPFDVAAFVAEVPEDEDAFGLFDRALDALDDRDLLGMTQALQASRRADWTSDTELRGWVDRNRQAMRLWRLGTERARSRPPWLDGTDVDSSRSGIQPDRSPHRLRLSRPSGGGATGAGRGPRGRLGLVPGDAPRRVPLGSAEGGSSSGSGAGSSWSSPPTRPRSGPPTPASTPQCSTARSPTSARPRP